MTAAIFGLLGVIVGAVINGAMSALGQRRTERADLRMAARLVRSELVRFRSLAVEARYQTPDDLPQLRDATPVLWTGYRATLSRALAAEQWEVLALAYAHVDALLSVLVFETDGTLVDWRRREALRLLVGMIEPVEAAARTLRVAAGVEGAGVGGDSEFPEQGPVAA